MDHNAVSHVSPGGDPERCEPIPPIELESEPVAPPQGAGAGAGARDTGLALIRRANRWLLAGAVTLAGALSLLARSTFHGRALNSAAAAPSASGTSGAASSASGTSAGAGATDSTAAGASLTPPDQAPAASLPSPSAVVSGGS
jgi:hypothetical protein